MAQLLEDFQSETINSILHGVNCFRVRHAKRIVSLGETMCYMGAKVSANACVVFYGMITTICKLPCEERAQREERGRPFQQDQEECVAEVHGLTEALVRLTEMQTRTEVRMGRLEEAVVRLDEGQRQLTEGQARTEAALQQTQSALQQLACQVGGLSETVGGDIEDIAYIVLYDVLAREFGWQVGVLERTWQTWNGAPEEVNIFGQATDPTRPERTIWIVGEAKHNLTLWEVERFARQGERARQHLPGEVFTVCFCYRARPEVRARLKALGIPLLFSYRRFA